MKFCIRFLIAFHLIIPILNGREFDERHFPIQDGGRIKPLDTFARNQLLALYGKRSVKHDGLSAIDWIID